MTEKEEAESYGRDATPEKAFIESDNHQFNGKTLQPYTPNRMWAADAMSLHYGHIDEAGMKRFEKEYVYPGAVSDVGIVLWLCSIDDEAQIDKARRDPVSASKDAAAWALEHGIASARSQKFWTAYTVFLRIMNEIAVSTGEPEKKTETNQPKESRKASSRRQAGQTT